jgi:hypothetical protein
MGILALTIALSASALAQPASKPVQTKTQSAQHDASAQDIVETPMTDLNLKKDEVPLTLRSAMANPYSLAGMTTCPRLANAVAALDAVLGNDFDLAASHRTFPQPGRMAQSLVGSFIPFRGIIREVSGASAQQRKLQVAILAGTARRGFLKGVGQQRGCRYPARPFAAAPQK